MWGGVGMASLSQAVQISFEIEPIVKVFCLVYDCRFNREANCMLKRILIAEDGKCQEYEKKSVDYAGGTA